MARHLLDSFPYLEQKLLTADELLETIGPKFQVRGRQGQLFQVKAYPLPGPFGSRAGLEQPKVDISPSGNQF